MREQESYEELIARRKKIRRRILLCVGSLLLAVVLFFGTVLFFERKIAYSYDELAEGLQITETENGDLLIEVEAKVFVDVPSFPSHWIAQQTHWQVIAVDEEQKIRYVSAVVYGEARRNEKWFGDPAWKTLYQETLSPHFRDENTVYEYQCSICEVYYAEWELPGFQKIIKGTPVLLWFRELPEGAVLLDEREEDKHSVLYVLDDPER